LPLVYGYLLPRCGSVAVAEDRVVDTQGRTASD
jgi:hypothetical protein